MPIDIKTTPAILDYLTAHNPEEPSILKQLRAETSAIPKLGHMQICPTQAALMQQLIRLIGAKTYLEIGTFTGISAMAAALALPDDGRVITLDYWPDWVGKAGKYWRKAGVDHKIEVIIGDAMETLPEFMNEGAEGTIDVAFIDADKMNMSVYFEMCIRLVRVGGLIIIDNVLWGGKVTDTETAKKDTQAIQAFNRAILEDDRVTLSMIPVGDGMTLAIKK